jgi:membrane associated rhomboid family serine protease
MTPMVRTLLVALAACYVLEMIAVHWLLRLDLLDLFWLTPRQVVESGHVWQVFTYMWLHDPVSPWHILLNGFGLYMFGGLLERRWGPRNFLFFYVATGLASGLVILGAGWWFYPDVPTLGASGAVLGLAAAFGLVFADLPVFLFGVLPMRARTLLLLILAMVLLDWLLARPGISVAGHLGGLASGALLVTGYWRPSRLRALLSDRFGRRPRVRFERDGPRDGGPRWVN